MALTTEPLPYGLRDVKLTAYTDAAGTVLATTSVDLPNGRTLSFSESEDFTDLRGDDKVVTSHGNGAQVDWELEAGGLPLEAWQIMSGGTIAAAGTTPAQNKTFTKKITDSRPFFRIEGQVISDSGGDVHCVIYRVKATGELSGEFTDGAFFLTAAKGQSYAVPSSAATHADEVYSFVQNETATAFVEPGV